MAITLNTLVSSLGTTAKVIVIDTAEDYKAFQLLVHNGSNLYPNLPDNIKDFAFEVAMGNPITDYRTVTAQDIETAFTTP